MNKVDMDKINKEILDLWKCYFPYSDNVFAPLLYGKLKKNALLFIGCNPSFSEKAINRLLTENADSFSRKLSAKEFFKWRELGPNDNADIIQYAQLTKEKYTYFKKFKEMGSAVDHEWEHIDLFYFRQTSQRDFKLRILQKGQLNNFGGDQLDITQRVIKKLDPVAIVVANAFASGLFREKLNAKAINKSGMYTILNNSKEIPVFCSSMLSGQRALDNDSFQRLSWQIDLIVNKQWTLEKAREDQE